MGRSGDAAGFFWYLVQMGGGYVVITGKLQNVEMNGMGDRESVFFVEPGGQCPTKEDVGDCECDMDRQIRL